MSDPQHYPVINVQDPVRKIVGRRKLRDAWSYAMGLQKMSNDLNKSFGFGALCPKGVYRFETHEEADRWLMKKLVERTSRRKI